jgi:hypothetical protein
MTRYSRRQLLTGAGRFAAALVAFQAGSKALTLVEQHRTWAEAAEGNEAFFARNRERLESFEIGGSVAPEQWGFRRGARRESLTGLQTAVQDLQMRQMRLGLRWSRVETQNGRIDFGAYRPLLDYCFANGVEVCLNPGPIRTFRYPEDHVPEHVLASLKDAPANNSVIAADSELAQRSLDYVERLMVALKQEYAASDLAAIRILQVENEPFYQMGEHDWKLEPAHVENVAHRLHAALPEASIMLTTAGRLNMKQVRDALFNLQRSDESYAGKLISGFDFHYRTPNRDSYPLIRHFDQISYARPGVGGTNDNIIDSREVGYRIEVTEGQMEPYGHFEQPGNESTDLRYMLQRCFDHVLDPLQPALVRVWGVEELVKKMMAGELTDEHRQIIALLQTVNDRGPAEVRGR